MEENYMEGSRIKRSVEGLAEERDMFKRKALKRKREMKPSAKSGLSNDQNVEGQNLMKRVVKNYDDSMITPESCQDRTDKGINDEKTKVKGLPNHLWSQILSPVVLLEKCDPAKANKALPDFFSSPNTRSVKNETPRKSILKGTSKKVISNGKKKTKLSEAKVEKYVNFLLDNKYELQTESNLYKNQKEMKENDPPNHLCSQILSPVVLLERFDPAIANKALRDFFLSPNTRSAQNKLPRRSILTRTLKKVITNEKKNTKLSEAKAEKCVNFFLDCKHELQIESTTILYNNKKEIKGSDDHKKYFSSKENDLKNTCPVVVLNNCQQMSKDTENMPEPSTSENLQFEMISLERSNTDILEFAKLGDATTTQLVKLVYEEYFSEAFENSSKGKRFCGCGVCEQCQQPDCGKCEVCTNPGSFKKRTCVKKCCPFIITKLQPAEIEEDDFHEKQIYNRSMMTPYGPKIRDNRHKISWIGDPVKVERKGSYYRAANIGPWVIEVGECVYMESLNKQETPLFSGRVTSMWEDDCGKKMFHCWWFICGKNTVLGKTADSKEIFITYECEDCSLSIITQKANIIYIGSPKESACQRIKEIYSVEEDETMFCQKRYDKIHGKFVDILQDEASMFGEATNIFCGSCRQKAEEAKYYTISFKKVAEKSSCEEVCLNIAVWKGVEFCCGDCVFLNPTYFYFEDTPNTDPQKLVNVNEDLYPEAYRKMLDTKEDILKFSSVGKYPFCVGYISKIFSNCDCDDAENNLENVFIEVNVFYRPENTSLSYSQTQQMDINKLYWTDKKVVLPFCNITGKCYVFFGENINMPYSVWSKEGPNRFFFTESYDPIHQVFGVPPGNARRLGYAGKEQQSQIENLQRFPCNSRKLRTLVLFAGCGGLAEGLNQSGVSEILWAVEKDEKAAHSFKLNHANCTVFIGDSNDLLKLIIKNEEKNKIGRHLPKKHEVDILCCSLPCYGVSNIPDSFRLHQYSLYKNYSILNVLAYCEIFQPRFIILETERQFMVSNESILLRLTLKCLLKMTYQCTFGVLQAGNFGLPQNNRRAVIMAALPGEALPRFPEPLHVFNPKKCPLSLVIDNKVYVPDCEWKKYAPLHTITIRDCISDLSNISVRVETEAIPYDGEALSHFQRQARGDGNEYLIHDHVSRNIDALMEARISHIPLIPGSDWRDLPNRQITLRDTEVAKKLIYNFDDKINGKSSTDALRGVCHCASRTFCKSSAKQYNTLIPWSLSHTANTHKQWAGIYSRLQWNGCLHSVITDPQPMGMQGPVIHPDQNRVVSVRECARCHGFPDTYRFSGTASEKYFQIGTSTPVNVAAVLGFELAKSVAVKEFKRS